MGGEIEVIKGPVAIKVGKYWIGIASGTKYCKKKRRTAERAIKDAGKEEIKNK